MDFLHRNANGQPQTTRSTPGTQVTAAVSHHGDGLKKVMGHEPKWLRITFVVLLFSLTILAISIAILLYVGKNRETHYVEQEKAQAVFLTNGQVYFGKIVAITDGYIDLRSIYYLNTQQQPETQKDQDANSQTNFSLVKLGCELHGPMDQMIINREQVSFWENLKSDGKVAKAIDQWVAQNPDGQTCSDSSTTSEKQAE